MARTLDLIRGYMFSHRMEPRGMRVMNYYFYRNLLIQVGVSAPILYVAKGLYRGELSVENRARIIVLLLIAGCFIARSAGLSRRQAV